MTDEPGRADPVTVAAVDAASAVDGEVDGSPDDAGASARPADGAEGTGEHLAIGARAARGARTYWPLLVIMAVALAIRVWSVQAWMPPCTEEELATRTTVTECYAVGGDAYHFRDVAKHLSEGEGFKVLSYATFTSVDVADHPPGFPLLLAAFNLMGLTEVTQHRLALGVVGAVGVGLIGLLGWRVGGRAVGITAGAIAALYPGFWMSEAYYMSESLFVPFIALTFLGVYRLWRHPTWVNAALAGVAGGLAWLVRGEAALVLGFAMVGFVLFSKSFTFWKRVGLGAVASVVCVALMLPWVIYNLNRFSEPIFIASTGTALALNSCDDVWYGEATGFYSFGCLNEMGARVVAEDGEFTDAGLRQRALEYQQENLGRLPAVMAIRAGRVFGVYAVEDTRLRNILAEGRRSDGVNTQQWFYYGFVAFAAAGAYFVRRRRVPLSPLLAAPFAVAATIATTFAIYRYRLAADVALLTLASAGLVGVAGWVTAALRGESPPGGSAPDSTAPGASPSTEPSSNDDVAVTPGDRAPGGAAPGPVPAGS